MNSATKTVPSVGAPAGNANAAKHGLRAGKLPPGCKHIENRSYKLRRQLEGLIVDRKGELSLVDAATVQTVIRWERHALLCQRWLVREADKLEPSERMQFSREVARASAERDKAIRALEIPAADDPIAELYRDPPQQPAQQPPQQPAEPADGADTGPDSQRPFEGHSRDSEDPGESRSNL